MLKINKKVEYALIALKYMAQKQQVSSELTSAREVCDQFKTPFDTTAKVMQKMNNHNILNSVKGIKGGYSLAINLEQITYMDLVKIIEGKELSTICESGRGLCECYEFCNIKSPIEQLNQKLGEYLENLTLSELLLSKGPLTSFSNSHLHQPESSLVGEE